MLDPQTGTRAWYGAAASRQLEDPATFTADTAIIVPRDARVDLSVDGAEVSLDRPGGVRIDARMQGQVAVKGIQGDVLLVRSEKAPSWYEPHGPQGQTFADIVKLGRPYPHRGWDASGLAWERGRAVAYTESDKRNLWTGSVTEWILNSTAWPGQGAPFVTGVSHVCSDLQGIHGFHDVRQSETFHRHPVREGRRQVEAYLITNGRAALATESGYVTAERGDLLVVEPGMAHCIAAVEGPYEHLAIQVPSTFQYGLLFKEEVATDMDALMQGGIHALKETPSTSLPRP